MLDHCCVPGWSEKIKIGILPQYPGIGHSRFMRNIRHCDVLIGIGLGDMDGGGVGCDVSGLALTRCIWFFHHSFHGPGHWFTHYWTIGKAVFFL